MRIFRFKICILSILLSVQAFSQKSKKNSKPNIIIITSDDLGIWDVSYNNQGVRGFETPNIDRIAKEGMTFTDYYAEQSCTAGRSTLITGQTTLRTGLSKVGLPGGPNGMRSENPTIATALKSLGYSTAQFGKNHLGDRDEHLPTMHGFDEFFGILYHLNAFNELELEDYPKDSNFRNKYGPRNPLRSIANEAGNQTITDMGPLTRERMRTLDDEFLEAGMDYIEQKNKEEQPFFVWMNSSRMHYPTYVPREWAGKSGQGPYADGVMQHDAWVGAILDKLDELGISENTIVIYNADNGPQYNTWPDAGITPYRSEKFTNWEGAFRVPCFIRWPEKIKKGSITNEIMSNLDWFPTLLAAAGDTEIKEKLLDGYKMNDKDYHVHLDGYNQLPLLTGETDKGTRKEFFYFTDAGEVSAIRFGDWKLVFLEQRGQALGAWQEPMVPLSFPKLFNLRRDPFERADLNSNSYNKWAFDRTFVGPTVQGIAFSFFKTFKEFPPQQEAARFDLEAIMNQIITTE